MLDLRSDLMSDLTSGSVSVEVEKVQMMNVQIIGQQIRRGARHDASRFCNISETYWILCRL